jgi:hypothetical protein
VTFNYPRAKATADRLLAKFGQAATLRRPNSTGPAYAPTDASPTDYPITVVVEAYAFRDIDGTRIRRDDLKVRIARGTLTVEPTTNDQLLIGGATYAVIDVRPENPGGTVLMYEAQARR